ncbi:MAG: SipW-dependent-type signal peptide-containing protein [Candidatus Staskawiczbacteria bacterium]|nr:SipW-dependent-type signal peptide-containing protein [Candidatus Staskawiczbacteria bacterium]
MKKIIVSTGILIAVAALFTGVTIAYFSDTELSAGNTFAAGAIDLTVDNESYYNGALSESTTWTVPQNLDDTGLLFFNFTDLKPDDEGEDTISLHVNNNDAYLCMDLALTSDDDRSSNEPELDTGDDQEDLNNTWDGELAQALQMFWWADDGDNVYEEGENAITNGIQTVTNMFGDDNQFSVALADSQNNVWGNTTGPVAGGETVYVAKAWCFGTLGLAPLGQDEQSTDGPLAPNRVGTGVTCNGASLGNITQTDGITLDVAFRTFQARHVPGFLCNEEKPRTATITVIKQIINDNGGNNEVSDFQLLVDNGVVETPVTSGIATVVAAGSYTVGESGISGYEASFSGDCDADGDITLNSDDNKTCYITNDDLPANIRLTKIVINNSGGTATPTQFKMRVDGVLVPTESSKAVTSNTPHAVTEDEKAGYHFVSITGDPGCPAVLGGTATLNEGEELECTITNDDDGGVGGATTIIVGNAL